MVIRLIQPKEPTGGAARATVDWIGGDAASFHQVRDTVEDVDLVILQHEYGIYGGPDGDEVLDLLRTTTTPSIAVLHTVLADPTPHQRAVLEEVIELADVTVTQTEAARLRLRNYAINDPERVIVIPHGAWTEPGTGEQRHHDTPLVLSWGLVGPGKGLEHGIAAMARLGDLTPTPTYLIAGETHPKVRAAQGERYREMLQRSAVELGIADRVVFDGTYRAVSSLAALIRSADIVLLPYDSRDQVTSGVLVEALAAGKPVVATRFPHAVEALASGAGLLVRHGDDAGDGRCAPPDPHAARPCPRDAPRGRPRGRGFALACRRRAVPRGDQRPARRSDGGMNLPMPDLRHLVRMTDDTGLFEHARAAVPRRAQRLLQRRCRARAGLDLPLGRPHR